MGTSVTLALAGEIINRASGNLNQIATELGIPISQLENGGGLVRVDFKLSSKHKVFMPDGNEFGANPLWLPGGKLPTGEVEAIVKTEGMIKNVDYTIKEIK